MTPTLQIAAVLASIAGGVRLGRHLVQLGLAYLSLRGSTPSERPELLRALAPAIAATSSRLPKFSDRRQSCQPCSNQRRRPPGRRIQRHASRGAR